MLGLLDLEQKRLVTVDIVDDLATQVVCEVVEELLVLELLARVDPFDLRASIVLGVLVFSLVAGSFFLLLVVFASLSQLLNLLLNFQDFVAHNV